MRQNPLTKPHVWLRVLETTDVHGHLMPYNYASDQETESFGLARTATLLQKARQEAPNTVLFDNGDFLQGSVLTDIATRAEAGWTEPNPVIAAMNSLNYDAGTLGNHEFNFGLPWLQNTLKEVQFPMVCANALMIGASQTGEETLLPPYTILTRDLIDSAGETHQVKIGVIGLLPPQITNCCLLYTSDAADE